MYLEIQSHRGGIAKKSSEKYEDGRIMTGQRIYKLHDVHEEGNTIQMKYEMTGF